MTPGPPPDHLRLLLERLERDEEVEFKTGAKVEMTRRFTVTTPLGAKRTFTDRELGAAYELGTRGAEPLPAPESAEQDERWGKTMP